MLSTKIGGSTLRRVKTFGAIVKNNLSDIVKVEQTDGIRRITMQDDKTRNSLTIEMTQKLFRGVTEGTSSTSLRAIVISSGGKLFSSGHNLKELANSDGRQVFNLYSELMLAIQDCPVPVITVIDGPTVAAGTQLVAQSDIAIASDKASFSTPGANYGIFCHTPGVALARQVPRKTAAYMLLTGLPLTAQEAYEKGLVTKVVESSRLENELERVCEAIKTKSKVVVSYGKKFFYRQLEMDLRTAYKKGAKVMGVSLEFIDGIEGLRSFSEKRKPDWKHVKNV